MKIEKTNLIDWLFDDGEWLSWTLLLLIPGIIIFVLVIPGLIIYGALLLILGIIDFITGILEKKINKQSITEESTKEEKKNSPRLVRGVLIDSSDYDGSLGIKRCILQLL